MACHNSRHTSFFGDDPAHFTAGPIHAAPHVPCPTPPKPTVKQYQLASGWHCLRVCHTPTAACVTRSQPPPRLHARLHTVSLSCLRGRPPPQLTLAGTSPHVRVPSSVEPVRAAVPRKPPGHKHAPGPAQSSPQQRGSRPVQPRLHCPSSPLQQAREPPAIATPALPQFPPAASCSTAAAPLLPPHSCVLHSP